MKKTDPRFQEKWGHLMNDNKPTFNDDVTFAEYITDRLTWAPPERDRDSEYPRGYPLWVWLLVPIAGVLIVYLIEVVTK